MEKKSALQAVNNMGRAQVQIHKKAASQPNVVWSDVRLFTDGKETT